MKKLLLKIYCGFKWFDIGNYSAPPWTTLMLIGNFLLSVIILLCFVCVFIYKPSKEVFTTLIVEKIIFISWLLLVWITPTIVSVIMQIKMPYSKRIQTTEFIQNESKMQNAWGEKSFFLQIMLYYTLLISPYFLGLLLVAFQALFVD